ncbi:MAG: glycosyltransferase family 39 protein [Candidatus Levybacteria bacterium]|nr:glycosyltransferase family 39 protein [Candidatus Levybacteria bacterium]
MKKFIILFLVFTFSIILRLWNLNEVGRTWDEYEYVDHGYKMIELIKNKDFNNSFFYTSYDHPPLVKYLYGITAYFDIENYSSDGSVNFNYDLTYSRMLSIFLFSLGVVITVIIGWKIYSPIVGVFSGIILSMLPFSLGLSQLVTTESLKIFIYPLVVYAYILLIKQFSWKKVLICGVVTGLALQAKQSNFLLIPMLFFTFFFQYKLLKEEDKSGFIKSRIKSIILILLVSVAVFILLWPQLPFHIKEVYEIHNGLWNVQFSPKIWQITLSPPEVFLGRLMLTPIFYYVVYFFITIPVLILFLFFVGARNMLAKNNLYHILILLWFLFPFLLSFYSWRQHGLRYIIEIYPAIAIISAVGFQVIASKITKKIAHQLLLFSFVVLYLSLSFWHIKPYYLDYFNELVGGVSSVYEYKLFQIGWWGQGIREASVYVKKNAEDGSSVGLAVSPLTSVPPMPKLKTQNYDNKKDYDYVIVNNYNVLREKFDDTDIKNKYKPVYFVKANNAILVTVYRFNTAQ